MNVVEKILTGVTALIGDLLYGLCSIFLVIVDITQNLFRSFAGIGEIWYGNEFISGGYSQNVADPKSGGILYYILQQDLVKDMIISIALLGLFLIIIFTVMAFIKNVYSAKQKKWQDIIGSSIKGLASFIVVPVMCMLGVWLSNILLVAIDGATRYGGNSSMSGTLFVSAAYNANLMRNINEVDPILLGSMKFVGIEFDENHDLTDVDYFADKVDAKFSEGFDWSNIAGVGVFYSTYRINYLFLIVAGFFIIQPLITMAFAMARRLFILVMLFVISPGVAALYPLDDGAALGNWKKQFIQTTIGAYGAVAGMNLFFSLYPLFDKIQWGPDVLLFATPPLITIFVKLFIMIVGLNLVNEFVGIISSYVGGENALDKGKSVRSAAKESFKKHVAGKATAVTGAFSKGIKSASLAKENGKSGFGAFAGSLGLSTLDSITNHAYKPFKEAWDKGSKEAEEKQDKSTQKKYKKDFDKDVYNDPTNALVKNSTGSYLDDDNFKKINEVLKSASYYGVSEDDVYKKYSKDYGIAIPTLKSEMSKYKKTQEESKEEKRREEQVKASRGGEYIGSINAGVANVRAANTNLEAAKTNEAKAQADKINADKALTTAENNMLTASAGLPTSGVGAKAIQTVAGLNADSITKGMIDSLSTIDIKSSWNFDTQKFAKQYNDSIMELIKANKQAIDAQNEVAEASKAHAKAQQEYNDSIENLKVEVDTVAKDFADAGTELTTFKGKTDPQLTDVEALGKAIKDIITKS